MSDEARICDFAAHDWADAGGGLEICTECHDERWAPRRPKELLMPNYRVVLMDGRTGVIDVLGSYGVPHTDWVRLDLDGGGELECGDDYVIGVLSRNARPR